jgi:hypothetical protein
LPFCEVEAKCCEWDESNELESVHKIRGSTSKANAHYPTLEGKENYQFLCSSYFDFVNCHSGIHEENELGNDIDRCNSCPLRKLKDDEFSMPNVRRI